MKKNPHWKQTMGGIQEKAKETDIDAEINSFSHPGFP